MKSTSPFTSVLIILLTIFVTPHTSLGQNQGVSVKVSYPIPIGDTFYSGYDGIISSGLKYSKTVGANFSLNGSFNYTRSQITFGFTNQGTTHSNFYTFIVSASPKIKLGSGLTISPEVGIGYSYLNFVNDELNTTLNESGFTTEAAFQLSKSVTANFSIGIRSSYNLILTGKPDQAFDIPFNKELHYINIGLVGKRYF